MAKTGLLELTTYVDPNDEKKIKKKRGEHGFISYSAYLRYLIDIDLGKVKPPINF